MYDKFAQMLSITLVVNVLCHAYLLKEIVEFTFKISYTQMNKLFCSLRDYKHTQTDAETDNAFNVNEFYIARVRHSRRTATSLIY